jgi:histidine phosphotransfer protein HptB
MGQENRSPGRPRHVSTRANHPDVSEILPLFVARLPGRVKQLRASLDAGDLDAFRDLVHQLKGAGGSYGFMPITSCSAAIEELLNHGRPKAEIESALEKLIDYIEDIEGYPRL